MLVPERLLHGCSVPTGARPSIVVTDEPSAWTARIVQLLTACPSISTVQAPHWTRLAADVRPVSASSLRRYCTRSVLGSTSARRSTLLTVNVIGTRTRFPLAQSSKSVSRK